MKKTNPKSGLLVALRYVSHRVAASRAAGMWAFGYAGGVTPAAALEGERTTVFQDMRDLARLLSSTGPDARGQAEKAE